MSGYTYEKVIPSRLFRAFEEIAVRPKEAESAQIRIHTERIEDNEHPLTSNETMKVPSLIVRGEVRIFLPGEAKPAWTRTFEAKTPDKVNFQQPRNSTDTGNFTIAVADATTSEMDDAVQGLFRYWWPEPELAYWRSFQEFRRWYANGSPSPAEALERLEALAIDPVMNHTLNQIHKATKELFEYQVAREKSDPSSEKGGISLEPIMKAVEYKVKPIFYSQSRFLFISC